MNIKSNFKIKSLDESGIFFGYASIFNNIDLQNEKILKGAFAKTLSKFNNSNNMPKMLWQHQADKPIGKWLEIFEDDLGLFVKGKIFINTKNGSDAYEFLKNNTIDSLSIGFVVNKSYEANKIHIIEELDLHEISLVTFAANPLAKITTYKNTLIDNYCIKKLQSSVKNIKKLLSFT